MTRYELEQELNALYRELETATWQIRRSLFVYVSRLFFASVTVLTSAKFSLLRFGGTISYIKPFNVFRTGLKNCGSTNTPDLKHGRLDRDMVSFTIIWLFPSFPMILDSLFSVLAIIVFYVAKI